MLRTIFYIWILTSSLSAVAQQLTFSGTVIESEGKKPLQGVNIINKSSGKWTVTDENGHFSIPVNQLFSLTFSFLGKEDIVINEAFLKHKPPYVIEMSENTLRLDDVVVTAAPQKDEVGSAITLDKYAISQFQSFSLADVLLQLPGQTISMPNLNNVNTISLRSVENTKNNAFGVSYILDDMPLSNDENMSSYIANIGGSYSSNINGGFDLRNIPSSNIEKIEVIQGVPDAKYGNVTSGVIRVERQAGVSPMRATASLNGGSTSVSVNRGFAISPTLGNLSLSFDYLNSNADPRKNLENFDRYTLSGIWTVSRNNRYKNTLSLTLQRNSDNLNVDLEEDDGTQSAKYKKDNRITFSNRGNWNTQFSFADNISYQVGFSYADVETYLQRFQNTGGTIAPTSLVTALTPGIYSPAAYLSKMQTFSEPLNINGRVAIDKSAERGNWRHSFSAGIDFNYSDNLGEGKIYDPEHPHTQTTISLQGSSQNGTRPLNFGEYVVAQKQLGVYLQDNVQYRLNEKQKFYANLGLRYDNQNGFSSVSPRINTAFDFSKNIKVRGAVGFTSKAPSLANVFPGNYYRDVLVIDYRTNYYAFNLVQTFLKEIEKNPLEPAKLWKFELGTDFKTNFATINATAYLNASKNNFTSETFYELLQVPNVNLIFSTDPTQIPTYEITGYNPYINSYSLTKNGMESKDMGVELSVFLKKIEAINTNFTLVGNYTFSKSISSFPLITKTQNALETTYLYGYYDREPSKADKFNFRLTSSYHSPELGLLVSLTSELFLFSTIYRATSNIYPYAYLDNQLNYSDIEPSQRDNSIYQSLFLNANSDKDVRTPAYTNFHLRITKEMLNGLSLSFYAINFLNYHPKVVNSIDLTSYMNNDISFGGNIKYVF